MSDNVQTFGLDASDYINEVTKIIQKNKDLGDSLSQLGLNLIDVDKDLDGQARTFKDLENAPKGFAAALKLLGGVYNDTRTQITLTDDALIEHLAKLEQVSREVQGSFKTARIELEKGEVAKQKALQATNRELENQAKVLAKTQADALAGTKSALQETRDQRVKGAESSPSLITGFVDEQSSKTKATRQTQELSVQLASIRQVAAEEARRNDLVAQQAAQANQLLNKQTALFVANEKHKTEVEKEQLAQRTRYEAEYFRTTQQLALDLPTFGNPTKKGQVTGSIGKISNLIESGQISSKRATSVVNEVTSGSTEVFAGAEAQVASFTRVMNSAKAALNQPEFGKPISGRLKDLGSDFDESGEKGKKSAEKILLSWQGMARLLVVQILHTGVREFLSSMGEAIDTTTKFQIKLSEIQTITQDQPRSTSDWAKSVRELSDAFGNPILEVTEGLYETISNQVGKGATAINFLNKALEFAKVTGSTTADAVNLLSSALNSFGLDTTQTERVASVFFTTIDKGRLRAQDIANTFGRVGPSAKLLGVSLEEVSAALAILTIKGVPPEEAITLLTNVMKGLVKPSADMTKFLHGIGVETGQQAINVNSFVGVLQKLQDFSKGSADSLSDLFLDLREFRGANILTDSVKDFAEFNKALDPAHYRKAVGIVQESPGQQLVKQLQQAKNIVLEDFGTPAVRQIVNISNALSDNGLAGILRTVIVVGKPLLGLFLAYRAALVGASGIEAVRAIIGRAAAASASANVVSTTALTEAYLAEGRANALAAEADAFRTKGMISEAIAAEGLIATQLELAASNNLVAQTAKISTTANTIGATALKGVVSILTNPIFLVTGAIAGAIALAEHYREVQQAIKDVSENGVRNGIAALTKFTDAADKSIAQQTQDLQRGLDRQFSAYQDFASKVALQIGNIVDSYREANEKQKQITDAGLNAYVKSYEEATKKVEENQRKTADAIIKSEQDLDKLKASALDNQFKRQLKFAEQQDRLAGDGIKTAQKGQLDLINGEIARIQDANRQLSVPTGNIDKDISNREQSQKNIQRLDELLNVQQEKRFAIESDRQRIAKEIADLEGKTGAESAERREQDRRADIEAQQRSVQRGNRSGRGARNVSQLDPLTDARSDSTLAERNTRRSEQDATNAGKLLILKKQLAAIDSSLTILPDTNALQSQAVELETEQNRLIEERIKLLQRQKDAQTAEIKDREDGFEKLKIALTNLEKFKFDPKNKTVTQPELDSQLTKFDALVAQARRAGLNDQELISKLVAERVKIEQEGQVKILAAREKSNADILASSKKELETRVTAQKQILTDQSKAAVEAAAGVFRVVGGNVGEKNTFDPGVLGRASGDFKNTNQLYEKIRATTFEIIKQQAALIDKGTPVDPNKLTELTTTLSELRKAFAKNVIASGINSIIQGEDIVESPNADPISGKRGPARTGFDVLKDAEDAAAKLVQSVNQTRQTSDVLNGMKSSIGALDFALKEIQTSYGALNNDVIAQGKSFKQLTDDVYSVITSMKQLKQQLDAQSGATPSKPQGFAFGGPIGTDTMIAAVTPGEFIVNKKASSKYYSQLVQMNRYESGGQVEYNSNIARPSVEMPITGSLGEQHFHFGGINVTGGSNPRYDARTLGIALEREIRLGRIDLSGGK